MWACCAVREQIIVVLGNHIEVTGDIFTPIEQALRDPEVGLVGGWGVRSGDLRDFESSAGPEVDAVEAYLLAFRRAEIDRVGLFDEKFRFYRHIDLEYQSAFPRSRHEEHRRARDSRQHASSTNIACGITRRPMSASARASAISIVSCIAGGSASDLLIEPAAAHYHDETDHCRISGDGVEFD